MDKKKSPSGEGRKVNYYNESWRSNITCDTIKKYIEENEKKLQELVKDKTLNEKCKIACDLGAWVWNEEDLGNFQNALTGCSLYWILVSQIGSYRINKYYHLNIKGETEASFFEQTLESIYNQINPSLQ